jgi:uncharacterized integral membrane protein (TIGR00697 family)
MQQWILIFLHILIIIVSNVTVQYPFTVFGIHTTWGALVYPLVFITTDLTVRLLGQTCARSVVLKAMFPGLVLSYLFGTLLIQGHYRGLSSLLAWNPLAFRVGWACFIAYGVGQWMDITVFQRFRHQAQWWVAPTASGLIGNAVDTYLFFLIAFYHGTDPILSAHWPEIAAVDFTVKCVITLGIFVPVVYRLILKWVVGQNLTHAVNNQIKTSV